MIPVTLQTEPADFDKKVRQKGISFLANHPNATAKMIRENHNYWTASAVDFYVLYKGYCAYSALWAPFLEFDHYVPISKLVEAGERNRAYEWKNFRPASREMNREKGDSTEVIDPFIIENGWFVINFKTINLVIEKGKNVPKEYENLVVSTIRRLKLNDRFNYIDYRCRWLGMYCEKCKKYPGTMELNFEYLQSTAPFIAYELERQGLKEEIIRLWEYDPEKTGGK